MAMQTTVSRRNDQPVMVMKSERVNAIRQPVHPRLHCWLREAETAARVKLFDFGDEESKGTRYSSKIAEGQGNLKRHQPLICKNLGCGGFDNTAHCDRCVRGATLGGRSVDENGFTRRSGSDDADSTNRRCGRCGERHQSTGPWTTTARACPCGNPLVHPAPRMIRRVRLREGARG